MLKYSLYFYIAFNYLLISAKPELDLIRRWIENIFISRFMILNNKRSDSQVLTYHFIKSLCTLLGSEISISVMMRKFSRIKKLMNGSSIAINLPGIQREVTNIVFLCKT